MSNNSMKINHDKRENKAISDIELIKQEIEDIRADINQVLSKTYPVGYVFMSFNNKSPAQLFGGNWQQLENGRVLLPNSSASGNTGGASSIKLSSNQIPTHSFSGTTDNTGSGLSASSWLNSTSTFGRSCGTSTDGNHNHEVNDTVDYWANNGQGNVWAIWMNYYCQSVGRWLPTTTNGAHYHTASVTTYYENSFSTSVSGLLAHTHTFTGKYINSNQSSINILNPYITVYMWKRIS